MKILLIGYGKMGKAIEEIALKKGHQIAGRITKDNIDSLQEYSKANTDVAIEFSNPAAAKKNISYCLKNGIPVVCGTTGWLTERTEIEKVCTSEQGSFFYASNYSIGVNLFFSLNSYLAKLMSAFSDYNVSIDEIHHTQKLDHPSGTAITLAEGILKETPALTKWVNEPSADAQDLVINSYREENIVGTHTVHYQSDIDSIEIKHTAHSRAGFAMGALLAAEWLPNHKGIFGMEDLLKDLPKN